MARRKPRAWVPAGILPVNKPVGPTSHDVVAWVRRFLPRRTKVGHTGTLDPFASGVLPLVLGGATRLADEIGSQPKAYRAVVNLSYRSDTLDHTGEVLERLEPEVVPDRAKVEQVRAQFLGKIEQVPPRYSAIRVDGKRAYDLARQGIEVEIPAREVEIYSLEVLSYTWPRLEFRALCSRGTYIRTLGLDLGRALGVLGCLESLVRESVGQLGLSDCLRPRDLLELRHLADAYAPIEKVLPQYRPIGLGPEHLPGLRNGQKICLSSEPSEPGEPQLEDGFWVGYLSENPLPLGIFRRRGSILEPQRVFLDPQAESHSSLSELDPLPAPQRIPDWLSEESPLGSELETSR